MIDEHASAAPKCPAKSHLVDACPASSAARTSAVHTRAQIQAPPWQLLRSRLVVIF